MGCTGSKAEVAAHPSQLELPGQNYLGSCWAFPKASPTAADVDAVPAWCRSCSGQLPTRAFNVFAAEGPASPTSTSAAASKGDSADTVSPAPAASASARQPCRNRVTGANNGFLLPHVHCDADGLDGFLSVFSDDDIRVKKSLSRHLSVAIGLDGVGVGGGAERKERHGSGSRDMIVLCTLETYRLSVDIARAVELMRSEVERREAAAEDREPLAGASTSTRFRQNTVGGASLTLYDVDPSNMRAYGDGCVTQVKCGGQLVIRVKQTNHASQLQAWGASMELGFSPGGGARVKGKATKRKTGGDQKLNVDIRHSGGPALPKAFHDCTIQDIEKMVQAWADGLARDMLLAVPIRVGVHRYDELGSLLLFTPSPTHPFGGFAQTSPGIPLVEGKQRGGAASPSFEEAVEPCAECATLSSKVEQLQHELEELRNSSAASKNNGANANNGSDLSPAVLGATVAGGSSTAAAPSALADEDAALLTSMVVPRGALPNSPPGAQSQGSPTTANQQALALYIAKCAAGEFTEVDLSQLASGAEAALWGAMCLMRCPERIATLRLSNLALQDDDASVLVRAFRALAAASATTAGGASSSCRLTLLDLCDNRLTPRGASHVVLAALEVLPEGAEVYLDNNWPILHASESDRAALAAAVERAAARQVTVSTGE